MHLRSKPFGLEVKDDVPDPNEPNGTEVGRGVESEDYFRQLNRGSSDGGAMSTGLSKGRDSERRLDRQREKESASEATHLL